MINDTRHYINFLFSGVQDVYCNELRETRTPESVMRSIFGNDFPAFYKKISPKESYPNFGGIIKSSFQLVSKNKFIVEICYRYQTYNGERRNLLKTVHNTFLNLAMKTCPDKFVVSDIQLKYVDAMKNPPREVFRVEVTFPINKDKTDFVISRADVDKSVMGVDTDLDKAVGVVKAEMSRLVGLLEKAEMKVKNTKLVLGLAESELEKALSDLNQFKSKFITE